MTCELFVGKWHVISNESEFPPRTLRRETMLELCIALHDYASSNFRSTIRSGIFLELRMDFFVYYRVRACDVMNLLPRVSALLTEAGAVFGMSTKLMRRPDEDNGIQTWMETYADVPPGFDEWLRSAPERHGVLQYTSGQRHVERFVQVPLNDARVCTLEGSHG